MTDNPFDAIRRITERIKQIADELDLELVNIAFMPEDADEHFPNDRNVVSAFFHIKPEAVKSVMEIEKEQLDEDFESILGGITVEEDEEGNVVLGGVSAEQPEEEVEEEVTEEEQKLLDRQAEAQEKLMKWARGQDE